MFVVVLSFSALAFVAYCAFSESDAGKKNYYIFLMSILSVLTTLNLLKVVE